MLMIIFMWQSCNVQLQIQLERDNITTYPKTLNEDFSSKQKNNVDSSQSTNPSDIRILK